MKKYDPLIFVKQSQLDKAVAFIELANSLANDDLVSLHLQNAIVEIQRRPTKHAPDVVESAASVSISPASEVSASEADSTPAPTQVM